jgi:hypothetical protein
MKRRHLLPSAGITLALPAFESFGFRAFAAENYRGPGPGSGQRYEIPQISLSIEAILE